MIKTKEKRKWFLTEKTQKEFFLSPSFKKILNNLASTVTRCYSLRKKMSVRVGWEPRPSDDNPETKEPNTAFTDGNKIYINMDTTIIPEDVNREERTKSIIGLLAHELGHVLFTNFKIVDKWVEQMTNLTYVNDCLISNKEAYDIYAKYPEIILKNMIFQIFNIIDDPFIEMKMRNKFPGSFKEGIVRNANYLVKGCLDALEKEEKYVAEARAKGEKAELSFFNLLLAQARGKLPEKYLDEFPELSNTEYCVARLFGMPAPDTQERLDLALIIYNELFPRFIAPIVKDLEEKMKEKEAIEKAMKETLKKMASELPEMAPSPSSSSSCPTEDKDELEKKDMPETDSSDKDGRGKGKKGESDDFKSKVDAGYSKKPTSVEDSKKERDESSSSEDSKGADGDEKSKSGAKGDTFADSSKDTIGESDHEDGEIVEAEKVENNDESPVTTENIESIINDVAGSIVGDESISREFEKYEAEKASDCDFHKGFGIRIHRVDEGEPRAWEICYSEIRLASKRLQKKVIDAISETRRGNVQYRQKRGGVDVKSFIRRDGNDDFKIFRNNKASNRNPLLAVSVCVDNSGSMTGDRIEMATAATVLLDDFCRGLNIPCSIYSHDVQGYDNNIDIYPLVDFDSKKSDRTKICTMRARANNRDGLAIRYGEQILAKRPEKIKLFFIISDGAPCAPGYYTSEALPDFADIKKNCEKEGIILIPFAIGSDVPALQSLYGTDKVIDCRDLQKLPNAMGELLTKEIKKIYKK